MKIKVTIDSTADVTKEFLDSYGISAIPLIVNMGGEEYYDTENITTQDIQAFVSSTGKLPKTAARSTEDFKAFFKQFLDDGYDEIVHFSISGELSVTYQNAKTASFELCQDKIHVIDGKNLSTGTTLLALHACELAKSGLSGKEIAEIEQSRAYSVQTSFVVDTLTHLYKGGRCSMLSMFGANLLKIRPQLQLVNGKIVPTEKYRGKMNAVLIKYIDNVLEKYNNPDTTRCFITHSNADPTMVEEIVEYVKSKNLFKEVIESIANATVYTHCGQGTLGILYINDGGKY